jgi:hypothetical protein
MPGTGRNDMSPARPGMWTVGGFFRQSAGLSGRHDGERKRRWSHGCDAATGWHIAWRRRGRSYVIIALACAGPSQHMPC